MPVCLKDSESVTLFLADLVVFMQCCNHPYLVNPSLQESLTNLSAKELLDFGIEASGKLKLLDVMLSEAESSKKRIIIITQV